MTGKIIVPVSGGKDSQLCLQMALEEHGKESVVAVHQSTGYDHPLTDKHLIDIENFYGIKIHMTKSEKYKDVFDFVEKVGYFPSSVAKSCTSRLKQQPFAKWLIDNNYCDGTHIIWMGMRKDESRARGTKYGGWNEEIEITLQDFSTEYRNKIFANVKIRLPIVDYLEKEVFDDLNKVGAPINPLYSKGHKRVGCYPCLLSANAEWERAAKDPVGRENIKKLIQIEEKFIADKNPRKMIKIHPTRNVRALLDDDLFTLEEEEGNSECSWCQI